MRSWKKWTAAAAIALLGATGANAASVTCGNPSLGIRVTVVDPALTGGLCYAGLDNLGDPALVTLMNSLLGVSAPASATLEDRDTANSNGGLLSITGVGAQTGTWSFNSSAWTNNDRLFLYFHFGDGQDRPGPTSETDPDIFIVELASPGTSGTWEFSGQTGLSNVGLLSFGNGGGGNNNVSEPASLALVGVSLLGLAAARRRRKA
jgi:hypothetical protein